MGKVIFPLNIFVYAYKGILAILDFLSGKKSGSSKLEGNKLELELKRVQQESNDFKRTQIEVEENTSKIKNLKLTKYKYLVKASNGEKLKGYFEAENKDDVRIFLVNNGYEIVSIEPCGVFEIDLNLGTTKISKGDLSFMLTQLSTYIKAGIPLIDSVKILAKQTTKSQYRKILDKVVFELISGEKFSKALEKQGESFPKLLINMIKTAEMTGDLSGTLDEMSEYYTQMEKTRKQMISALTYPTVIFCLAIAALVFVILFVVPNFVNMFESNGADLPGITKFVIAMTKFFQNYWITLAIVIFGVLISYILIFKYIKSFRKFMQTIYMKLPVFGKIIIYNEVANLTRTFASLLNHNVFITDCMDILSKITDNEIYKDIINRTLIGLSKGNKISDSFKGEWAFPIVAYEMLVTGENTGQLNVMMEKVANHYQELHSNMVSTIKSLIEPFVICVLAFGVGFIVLSIVVPMFDIYSSIGMS